MKILFLAKHLNAGGITSYLLALSKGLINLGNHIYIVSSGGEMEGNFSQLGVELLEIDLDAKSILDPKIYFQLSKVKSFILKNQIDVVHANTRVTQVMGQLLSKYTKGKYVSTCHGYFKPKWSRTLFPCWGKRVIAISSAVRDHLIDDFGLKREKIDFIRSSIDPSVFIEIDDVEKARIKESFGFTGKILIGMVARLSDVKGQDILIRAFKDVVCKNQNAYLVLVGKGKFENELKELILKLELGEYVSFYPEVDKTVKFLTLIDIFINPSRQEGLGLSVMEAQAAGLPVIASKVGGVIDLIEDGETGYFFESENAKDLADKINKVTANYDKAKLLGKSARSNIVNQSSIIKMAQKVQEVYSKV